MIAVIDPALFLTARPEGALEKAEETSLSTLIDDAARVCRDARVVIPNAAWYWSELQRDLVRPLLRRVRDPRLKQGLDALQRHAQALSLPEQPQQGHTRMWGVRELFAARPAWQRLDAKWLGIMERLLVGCAQNDDELILIARLDPGRNQVVHAAGGCTLEEKTRWRLYVHVPGRAPRHVPCVRNPRNLSVPWTARFDEKLPDGGRFPFCPRAPWWKRATLAFRTVRSKPAWFDRFGNGWAQPATGGSYHWDVFIDDPNLVAQVGLDAINVSAFGSSDRGKTPGQIHHVPEDKKPLLKPNAGWTCPPED